MQDCRHLYCQNVILFAKIQRTFVRQTKGFAGQNENLPILSSSPAFFVKTDKYVSLSPS